MAVGMALLKIGLTAAAVTTVVVVARQIHQAKVRQAETKSLGPGPLRCEGPIYTAEGIITGFWAKGSVGQPACVPECAEGHAAVRVGPGELDWECQPLEAPPPPQEKYPAADACVANLYNRGPLPPENEMYKKADIATQLVLQPMRFHLAYIAQNQILLDLLNRIAAEPSVRSVMVRRALEELAPDCDWWLEDEKMLPSQRLVFEGAMNLSLAAETELGWEHPTQARKNMIPRDWLGIAGTGTLDLAPGQHVEILVVEGPQMRFGEHILAKTISGGAVPRVVVVPTFRGLDVAPRFGHLHGFSVGTEVGLESEPPTSAYRVYPKEWQS